MNPGQLPPPSALRRTLWLLGVAAAMSAIGLSLEGAAAKARDETSAALAEAQARLAQRRASNDALHIYGQRYLSLRRRGVIAEESRLRWVEAVQRGAQECRLRHVTFELQPASDAGSIRTSRMTLRVGLTHEEELLRFIDRLRAHAPAGLWVRRCAMQRAATPGPFERDADNLIADCDLEWLTVRAR